MEKDSDIAKTREVLSKCLDKENIKDSNLMKPNVDFIIDIVEKLSIQLDINYLKELFKAHSARGLQTKADQLQFLEKLVAGYEAAVSPDLSPVSAEEMVNEKNSAGTNELLRRIASCSHNINRSSEEHPKHVGDEIAKKKDFNHYQEEFFGLLQSIDQLIEDEDAYSMDVRHWTREKLAQANEYADERKKTEKLRSDNIDKILLYNAKIETLKISIMNLHKCIEEKERRIAERYKLYIHTA